MSRFDLFFVLVDDCNEVTDYAIARRIVELHSQKEQVVQRVYSMVSQLPQSDITHHPHLLGRRRFVGIYCLLGSSSPRSARPVLTIWWRSIRDCVKETVLVGFEKHD